MYSIIETVGDAVGQTLTRSEIEVLCDLFERVQGALIYLAELPAAGDGKDDYNADADELGELIDALHKGEKRYRED